MIKHCKRWLVCGGRDFTNRQFLYKQLDALTSTRGKPEVVIHGAYRGADLLADGWAKSRGIRPMPFKANWVRFGGAAGPMRNQRMIDEGCPDLVVAFPGGSGTADMKRRAEEARITIIHVYVPH